MLDWFTKLFLFTLYIRVLVEAILFIFVSVMLEITQFESAHDHPLSYTISWLSLIVIIIATMLIPKHYFDYREYSNIDSEYFSELYNGTKDTKICKLYTFIFIMRRLITAFLIVFLRNLNVWPRCIFFTIVQIAALTFSIIYRPFSEAKNNIIEIMNEAIFSVLCVFVTICNDPKIWFSELTNILIYALTINGSMISVVLTVDLIINCVQKCRKRRRRKRETDVENLQNLDTPSTQRTDSVMKKAQAIRHRMNTPQVSKFKQEDIISNSHRSFSTFRKR